MPNPPAQGTEGAFGLCWRTLQAGKI